MLCTGSWLVLVENYDTTGAVSNLSISLLYRRHIVRHNMTRSLLWSVQKIWISWSEFCNLYRHLDINSAMFMAEFISIRCGSVAVISNIMSLATLLTLFIRKSFILWDVYLLQWHIFDSSTSLQGNTNTTTTVWRYEYISFHTSCQRNLYSSHNVTG